VLRCLNDADVRLREHAERSLQYIDAGDKVGVEQEDESRPPEKPSYSYRGVCGFRPKLI
jgi:hypothetical protein